MSKKLFVGNLSFNSSEDELNSLFAAKGQVASAKIIMDRDSGRSKGFGFVEMTDDNEAQQAIDALNNSEIDGRKIVVNEARPMVKREGGFKKQNSGFRNNRNW